MMEILYLTKLKEQQKDQLSPGMLRLAYMHGYFPMPHPETNEILWFHPDPRAILPLGQMHVSRSLRRTLKRSPFEITINLDFKAVISACSRQILDPITNQKNPGNWINEQIIQAYTKLHEEGDAHSLEVWLQGELAGGIYGVSQGGAFFAESKFHKVTDASKVALYYLQEHLLARNFQLLEVQFLTPHLQSLGVKEISRTEYLERLALAVQVNARF
jgi:leucyl/phenylalanyl-tRNA--protein transferase